jgi:hypothetical protein
MFPQISFHDNYPCSEGMGEFVESSYLSTNKLLLNQLEDFWPNFLTYTKNEIHGITSVSRTKYVLKQYPSTFGARIAQRYSAGLRAGWSGVPVPVGARNFSLHHRVQTGSGANRPSHTMGNRDSFLGGEPAGAWKLTTHLHLVPRSRMRSYTSTPQ